MWPASIVAVTLMDPIMGAGADTAIGYRRVRTMQS